MVPAPVVCGNTWSSNYACSAISIDPAMAVGGPISPHPPCSGRCCRGHGCALAVSTVPKRWCAPGHGGTVLPGVVAELIRAACVREQPAAGVAAGRSSSRSPVGPITEPASAAPRECRSASRRKIARPLLRTPPTLSGPRQTPSVSLARPFFRNGWVGRGNLRRVRSIIDPERLASPCWP